MKPKVYGLMTALVCAALMSGPLHAASDDGRKAQAEPRAEEKNERAQKKPSRFETCKRDARGKNGSERASFMTECLHDRH